MNNPLKENLQNGGCCFKAVSKSCLKRFITIKGFFVCLQEEIYKNLNQKLYKAFLIKLWILRFLRVMKLPYILEACNKKIKSTF